VKTLYFDCFCGAAGDMIVGALIDAGADYEKIKESLSTLDVDGYELSCEKVNKHGTMATKFDVHLDETTDQPHRHLRHIVDIINSGELPESVKQASLDTFQRVAECEAEVHGTTIQKVHFHEVGAVDSIIDIVGTHLALDQLKPDTIHSSSLHVGSGTVKCAHGIMPVPAPATALLLRGIPSYSADVDGELVTPTGAALIAQLAESFGPMPEMITNSVGVGSGTKDIPDRPNVVRVLLGQASGNAKATETVTVIEANIDDMNPEHFPILLEEVLTAGAKDAFITPIMGKKGRPAHLVSILTDEESKAAVIDQLIKGSSTLGIRMRQEDRICLDREWKTVTTSWGDVKIKLGSYEGTVQNIAPEHDDCVALARESGASVKEVYQAALAAAVKGEFNHG